MGEVVQLPDDLICSILLRLPPESLIRFYTLSKRWNHVIISNTFFADYRARVSIIVRPIPNFRGEYYSHVRLHRLCPLTSKYLLTSVKDSPTVRIPFPLTHDDEKQPSQYWISSSNTDGLLCVVYRHAFTTDIAVWNPCTNRHRTVTWNGRIWDDRHGSINFVGFGYDARVCNYKVVLVCRSSYAICDVYVTSLKSGVWRRADDAHSGLYNEVVPSRLGNQFQFEVSIAVGHDLYWLCKKTEDNSLALLSFNLIEEKLTVLSLPLPVVEINKIRQQRWKQSYWVRQLGVSNGCLHLFCLSSDDDQLIDIWKHSKDGSGEKWNRVLSPELPRLFAFGYCYEGSSVGFVSHEGGVLVAKSINRGIFTYTPQRGLAFMNIDHDEQPSRFNPSIHLLETSFVIP